MMTNAYSAVDFAEKKLELLENQALKHYDSAVISWQAFVKIALEIQASNLWQKKAPTWAEYCHDYMPVSASRIRQYKVAIPLAEILKESTGKQVTEKQVRDLRQVLGNDSDLLLQVYRSASELSGGLPAKRHFEAVYETLKETAITGAVSVSGLSMPASPETLDAAQKEAIIEADMRFKQHRNPSKSVKVMAKRVGKLWELTGFDCEADSIELLYYEKG